MRFLLPLLVLLAISSTIMAGGVTWEISPSTVVLTPDDPEKEMSNGDITGDNGENVELRSNSIPDEMNSETGCSMSEMTDDDDESDSFKAEKTVKNPEVEDPNNPTSSKMETRYIVILTLNADGTYRITVLIKVKVWNYNPITEEYDLLSETDTTEIELGHWDAPGQ